MLEKIYGLLFSVSTIVDPLKGGPRANVSNASFLKRSCWCLQFFFVIKYLMLNLTKCLLEVETFALIH